MKKTIFMAVIAASMGFVTSCSQDDDFTSNSGIENNTIAFSTRPNKVTTRSGVSINSIDKFTVTAVDNENASYFNNELFSYDGTSGVFKSQKTYYWPTTGTLNFFAISDPGSLSVDTNNTPMYSYTNWAAEKDLVAATVRAGEKVIPYPLHFQHLTSQIYVSAEADDKTEVLNYKLVSVKLSAPSDGVYSFDNATGGTGTWQIDNSKTSEYSYNVALPMTFRQNGQIELSSCYWNILPVKEGMLSFSVEYQVIQNNRVIADYTGERAKKCEVENPNLLSGKRYTYNFKLTRGSDDAITFVTTMSDWEDGNRTNGEFVEPMTIQEVDMGVPSGLKWASVNVGATSDTDPGLHFMWGEITGHANDGSFIHFDRIDDRENDYYSNFGKQTTDLTIEQDAARANLGGNWRMPTKEEYDELISSCSYQWYEDYNGTGVSGCVLTSNSNGNKLFFPANIDLGGTELTIGASVSVWASTANPNTYFGATAGIFIAGGFDDICESSIYGNRYYCLPVRAVCE